jgi:type II secretory pathway pseudopilin PulG
MAVSLKKQEQGFTIVELIIVIVVVIGLGYLLVSNYSAIKSKQRNQTRQNDLKALQLQIETYYSKTGYYPSLDNLNSAKWRATNMKDLSSSDLVDPLSKCDPDTSSCLGGQDKAVPHQYEYYVTQSDGTTSCNGKLADGSDADQDCAKYKLITAYEGKVNGSKIGILENRD